MEPPDPGKQFHSLTLMRQPAWGAEAMPCREAERTGALSLEWKSFQENCWQPSLTPTNWLPRQSCSPDSGSKLFRRRKHGYESATEKVLAGDKEKSFTMRIWSSHCGLSILEDFKTFLENPWVTYSEFNFRQEIPFWTAVGLRHFHLTQAKMKRPRKEAQDNSLPHI